LVLFGAGIALALWHDPALARTLGLGPWLPRWSPPAVDDFRVAIPRAALPQVPLTTLNSVVAVCALSLDLFPGRECSPRRVSVSVGLMNLVGCFFGAMPMCHGAGGLAGQHRFGARTNGSILFLGAAKMALAVAFGGSLMALCGAFPASILGVMLAFSGLELALVARDQTGRDEALVMLATAAAALGLNNMAAGFGVGVAVAAIMGLLRRWAPPTPLSSRSERPASGGR
jgi:MFS superfamily sulfate permease-like transporter